MKILNALASYLTSTSVLAAASNNGCKCTPNDACWPLNADWTALNTTLSGALIKGVPPGSVCYADQPNYNPDTCAFVRSRWFNSTWHATDPISIDYPVWANNSCNPIYENGTSVTGDRTAGKRGCSIGKYPVYAVNVTSAEQIAQALEWARKKNIRVVIKGTGHSYPGRSTGYGSLSIWTHNLRGISYLPSFNPDSCPINGTLPAARIAAGHTGIEVQLEMAKHAKIVVTGANPDVGMVGWITGGGHGLLSSTYGMGADNLLEATIVTPSGDILLTNPCKNSDLFFAIRGGGGSTYGVVTEIVVKAYPSPRVTRSVFHFAATSPNVTNQYWDLVAFIHAEMPRLKVGGMQGYYYMVGPPTYPTLAMIWTFFLYDKPNGTVESLLSPIEERLKSESDLFQYQSEITTSETFIDAINVFSNEPVASGGSAYASWFLSPRSLANPNITADVFKKIGPTSDAAHPNGVISNPGLLGHLIASPSQPSYYPNVISMNSAWRITLTNIIIVEGWPEGIAQPLIDSVYSDVTAKTQYLRDLSPETGAYFNEPDSYEPQWQHAFFGGSYGKLWEIKRTVDPYHLLWCRRCVGSEALVEQNDGRLCRAYGD
ncbi:FAD binding domain-containing protein [Byssothecium circinans]|uniref:FAD binding domain-containing protein n=1 Tax=Byssothecium circinans TaxID=147558 RepID=A0A6A5UCS8_9PLEO|nr:FAD binding domain-containing protein [Byssothecium circinans]